MPIGWFIGVLLFKPTAYAFVDQSKLDALRDLVPLVPLKNCKKTPMEQCFF